MTTADFDYTEFFRPDLPPAAQPWEGIPKFNYINGHIDAEIVPVGELITAAADVLRRDGKVLAMYGMHSGPLGYLPLREFVAEKLRRRAGIECTPDQVLITSGSLQALDLVNGTLLAPGDTVVIEKMNYGGTLSRMKRLGVEAVGVDLDRDGMVMESLERALEGLKRKGVRPKFIYTIPTVQNPTGTVMPEARRRELLRLSEAYGVPVFEDECYSDLTWDGVRPQALRGMAGGDRVIHIGSFSKTVAPALRVGYIVAGWPVLSRILPLKTDGGTGALEQMVLAEYCRKHFDNHVTEVRRALRRKIEVLMGALRDSFGDAAEFDDPPGGPFLWVKLPEEVDTTRLTQVAQRAGIAINPGADWMTDTGAGRRRIRICFALPSEQSIRDGVAQLAEVCHREFGVPKREAKSHR